MAQTNVNIRMDEDLKKQFDAFCTEVGMNMTTAFCVFAKTAVREQKIPFEIKADIPNTETIKAMQNVLTGTDMSKAFTSVKDLMEDLNAEN
ncbi:MAG: type II toxin-antitoxin system RelB/DinJ family antitoxin [Clostridiales bacterium]